MDNKNVVREENKNANDEQNIDSSNNGDEEYVVKEERFQRNQEECKTCGKEFDKNHKCDRKQLKKKTLGIHTRNSTKTKTKASRKL